MVKKFVFQIISVTSDSYWVLQNGSFFFNLWVAEILLRYLEKGVQTEIQFVLPQVIFKEFVLKKKKNVRILRFCDQFKEGYFFFVNNEGRKVAYETNIEIFTTF